MAEHPMTVRPFPRVGMLLWAGVSLFVAAMILGAAIFFFRGNGPFLIDEWWMTLLAATRGKGLLGVSYVMNFLGAGWFGVFAVPIAVAVAFLIARRPWAAVFFVGSSIAGAALVQIMKHVFGRARPEEIIVISDFGSFPSGHVANAATIAVAVWVLFPRIWVALVGAAYILLMAFSRTYLGAHWFSDTIGGMLVGASAALLVAAAFARPLEREWGRKRLEEARSPSLG
ncbi:MAG TPA: phosphatase PAP2 family protein [Microbacterium sp.]|uniref:phosphatase PAP2 family protein n=1 Tax=Microbacterium sp. TaxID=51671 RepID=UPI002C2C71B7|nr:phosphatase PAP2 family protein [Microbacterium sp.]HWI31570.1 phosphatase PAP2 family protein [Microbacterium sp.]